MTGFSALFRKELREIVKTWRIWVVPGMVLFFAVTSPIAALVAPSILSAMAASKGAVIQLPEPTAVDACQQFLKNLNQAILLAIVIAGAGCISNERRSGVAGLILTKPISRTGFVLAKMLALQSLVAVAVVAGTALCALITFVLFGEVPLGGFIQAVSLWLVYAALLIVVMTFLSATLLSYGAATGAGLGFYFLAGLLSIWDVAVRCSPPGLLAAGPKILAAQPVDIAWPLATALLGGCVLAWAAVLVFRSKDI